MLRATVEERSAQRIVQSDIQIKTWIASLPSVDQVRPARCPCCGAAGRPIGCPLVLVGHGLRERELLGPPAPEAPPEIITVRVRRYRCTICQAILTVVPRGVLRRRLYAASAIGWVLARIGFNGAATAQVRTEVCPAAVLGYAATSRWIAVSRWLDACREGRLFPRLRPHAPQTSRLQVAERTAMQIIALAPLGGRGQSPAHACWHGAALAA